MDFAQKKAVQGRSLHPTRLMVLWLCTARSSLSGQYMEGGERIIMMCDNFLFETRLDWLVTGSEIGFARHMGLAHNRLDDTIIKCGDGGFWPRLVVILKKKINFDDLTLEETWESTSALHTKVAFGKVIANRMFRSVGFCPQSLEPKLRWLFNFRFRQTREGLHPLIWQFTWRELTKNRQKRKNKNITVVGHKL